MSRNSGNLSDEQIRAVALKIAQIHKGIENVLEDFRKMNYSDFKELHEYLYLRTRHDDVESRMRQIATLAPYMYKQFQEGVR